MNKTSDESSRVFDCAVDAGRILLSCGAEIYRAQETMERIVQAFGCSSKDFFVMINGIIATIKTREGKIYTRILNVPISGITLDKIEEVNRLSREIERQHLSIDEVEARLSAIKQEPDNKLRTNLLAAGIGSACFTFMITPSLPDSLAAGLAGLLVQLALTGFGRFKISKIVTNIICGFIAVMVCTLLRLAGIEGVLSHMVLGAVMPLIPGVPLVLGIRELMADCYLSGIIRLLDTVLILCGIGIGVYLALQLTHLTGVVTI